MWKRGKASTKFHQLILAVLIPLTTIMINDQGPGPENTADSFEATHARQNWEIFSN